METEENLYQTAQAERGSYERELRLTSKTFHELEEQHFALQVCLKKGKICVSKCYIF